MLRNVGFLRSGYYLALELRTVRDEPRTCSRERIDQLLAERRDPWRYETNPREQERFRRQASMLDAARGGGPFRTGLEIGCAEGLFTEVIAERCESLRVLDLSPTALTRATGRREWPALVQFRDFDLRQDEIPGKYDLIVVAGVLEYFSRRATMQRVRDKLVAALEPGGHLLVESTRCNPVVEGSWWGRYLVRGRWINHFISKHAALRVESEEIDEMFAITMLKRLP